MARPLKKILIPLETSLSVGSEKPTSKTKPLFVMMKKSEKLAILYCSALFCFTVQNSVAATMIDGSGIIVSVSSVNGALATTNFPPQSVVDGTGLNVDGTHSSGGKSEWYTNNGQTPALSWISFDLGATFVLDSMHVWNAVQYPGYGIAQLDIYVSTLVSPGDPEGAGAGDWTQIGTDVFFAAGSTSSTGFDLETQTGISLPATALRHVAFYSDTQIGGGTNYLGLAEVQFFAVPEPSAALLGGLGALLLLRRRRR